MFYLRYILSELRRRRGRTIVSSLGLGVGVGLVVTVSALSSGLDSAQQEVLEPLTGVGTDMSVSRPIAVSGSGENQTFSAGAGSLPPKEQRQLREENGDTQVDLRETLAELQPGERFATDSLVSTNLSFPESQVDTVGAIDGVEDAGAALTLDALHVTGRAAESKGSAALSAATLPENLNVSQETITGIDSSQPDVAMVTRGQVSSGRYLKDGANRQALVSRSYAEQNGIDVGDEVSVAERSFKVVGIASPPLGGQSSDIFVPLVELQELSDRQGRVNMLLVRAASGDQVDAVSSQIESEFAGARVTTAEDLAGRVSGSLVDAQSLTSKLGTALEVVALLAAWLIASLLTLSSVAKRTREIGTLKALGWRQGLVVRQVMGETLAQGFLGGLVGIVLGLAGTAMIAALGIGLQASVASGVTSGPLGIGFGQGEIASGSSTVTLDPSIGVATMLLAVTLAIAGGLVAGAVGGNRAARLRPAAALRSVE